MKYLGAPVICREIAKEWNKFDSIMYNCENFFVNNIIDLTRKLLDVVIIEKIQVSFFRKTINRCVFLENISCGHSVFMEILIFKVFKKFIKQRPFYENLAFHSVNTLG